MDGQGWVLQMPYMKMILMVLYLRSSTKLMISRLRKTEDALCDCLLAKQGAYLEGAATFPHNDRTSRNSGQTQLSFED